MSDEAAFLAALKANPADDTTRLVYADWLEENDEALKAEYLRFVVVFAQRAENLAAAPGAERFIGFGVALTKEWRTAAGSRFALVLDRYTDIVKTIKFIREVTGCGLSEARSACWSLPQALLSHVPFEDASAACEYVRSENFVELSITSCTPNSP
jgi:uncharacterized protein (TIGR02996 family)